MRLLVFGASATGNSRCATASWFQTNPGLEVRIFRNNDQTRMHSSGMHTDRRLTVSGRGGGVSGGGGGVSGGVYPGMGVSRGVWMWHTLHPRGQTDTCENITFPILRMRSVITAFSRTYSHQPILTPTPTLRLFLHFHAVFGEKLVK